MLNVGLMKRADSPPAPLFDDLPPTGVSRPRGYYSCGGVVSAAAGSAWVPGTSASVTVCFFDPYVLFSRSLADLPVRSLRK